ncbi:MAG: cytoplasmic protein [Deltaproteobacteria bacterium]|nr:cytoplasmic protein [Deltaproteobacteria bacterium]
MTKQDIILKSPLGNILDRSFEEDYKGSFFAVLARAGVGKTAFLVQLALNAMVRERNVLHVSLSDPVKKVTLRYSELFDNLIEQSPEENISELWQSMLPYRFIMTFRKTSFSVPKFKERLTDLTEQDIFMPDFIIVDGLDFDETIREKLIALKELAKKGSFHVWFSVNTHRDEEKDGKGMPLSFSHVEDLFNTVLKLKPEGTAAHIETLKGMEEHFEKTTVVLDASSMLIRAGSDG